MAVVGCIVAFPGPFAQRDHPCSQGCLLSIETVNPADLPRPFFAPHPTFSLFPQFKESAWRKQSLYLKFDPLLKESPLRPVPMVPETNRRYVPLLHKAVSLGQRGGWVAVTRDI